MRKDLNGYRTINEKEWMGKVRAEEREEGLYGEVRRG
jgi:hypothetical protein